MLIRLAGHYINNPNHIDKLICINGLPDEWIFRKNEKYGGVELAHPLVPDIAENIPQEIRHLCTPVEIIKVFPPIEKGRESVVDKMTILGVRFDYMTEPGQAFWEKVERYLDRMTPRDEKVEAPVLVAPNHKSPFSPHKARRTVRGSLEFEKCEIPVVDLKKVVIESPVETKPVAVEKKAEPVVEKKEEKPVSSFSCDKCGKVFEKPKALSMHKLGAHRERNQPVGV